MLHWFDLFVVFFLFTSAIWSYFRGFAKEVFSVSALVIGYFAASSFYKPVAPMFERLHPEQTVQEISAFLSLFFGAVIFVVILSSYARRILKVSDILSSVDKIAGFAVGIFKGGLILSLLAYPFSLVPGMTEGALQSSFFAPILIGTSGAMLEKVAPSLAKDMENMEDDTETVEKGAETIDKYRKKLEELDIGAIIGKKDNNDEAPIDKIDEKDRAEMNALIENVDQ